MAVGYRASDYSRGKGKHANKNTDRKKYYKGFRHRTENHGVRKRGGYRL